MEFDIALILTIMLGTLCVLVALNVPIAIAVGISTFLTFFAVGLPSISEVAIAQNMIAGLDIFTLLGIPMFILSGVLMRHGGIAEKIMAFAAALVSKLPGGFAAVNVLSCMLFGCISGSAVAGASSIGSCMIPEMEKRGYPPPFNAAVTTTAAVTGLLIPPSNVILIYALASGTSVAGLFLAGILPGILFGVLLMIAAVICCRWCGFGERSHAPFSFVLLWKTFWGAFPGLSLAVIVMLGIVKGWVTATEAAAIAAAYALFLSMFVYKRVKVKDLPKILVEAGILISVVLFLIATSTAMCWLISLCHIPEYVSSCLINMFDSPFLVLLMINILLLLVGAFTDLTPVIVIFTPILLPVVQKFGMHPIQFGIVMVANLSIGLCTPPVGTSLFVSCALAKSSIGETSKYMVIFVIFMLIGLLLITHFPWFTMCLQ